MGCGCLGEVGRWDDDAVDHSVGAGVNCLEEGFQECPGSSAVACTNAEAGEVHNGFERMLGVVVMVDRSVGEPMAPRYS
jgi:hypothetical protein